MLPVSARLTPQTPKITQAASAVTTMAAACSTTSLKLRRCRSSEYASSSSVSEMSLVDASSALACSIVGDVVCGISGDAGCFLLKAHSINSRATP
jgi:hypothetical protein